MNAFYFYRIFLQAKENSIARRLDSEIFNSQIKSCNLQVVSGLVFVNLLITFDLIKCINVPGISDYKTGDVF